MMKADPTRPEAADAFELKGRMAGILIEKAILLIRQGLDRRSQRPIRGPKLPRRSASKLGGFARRMIAKGSICQRVEFPCFCVSLDLAIPRSRIKLGKPPPELCEFLGRETGHSLLDGLELAHITNDNTFYVRA